MLLIDYFVIIIFTLLVVIAGLSYPDQYTKKLGTKVKGVLNIPSINKDKPIFIRMRVRKQWGFASEWTHEIKL